MVELESWSEGATRSAIVEFVEALTVPAEERVAVFDNDGTLWCEKPMPIELDYLIRRFAVMAAADPSLARTQPFAASAKRDFSWFGRAMVKHYHGDESDVKLLLDAINRAFVDVPVEEYAATVDAFFGTATHPILKRPYLACGYQPMIELMRFLEARGFTNYIASGGDRDFVRPVAQTTYGIPPEQIIGSAIETDYVEGAGDVGLVYKDHMEFFDDGPAKPVRIWGRVGRRPTIAVGNSNGDVPMLRFAGGMDRPALRILISHDDAEREFSYTAGAEEALQLADDNGWTVVSMANDWSRIFTA
jgi:phosphoserine phosphatase